MPHLIYEITDNLDAPGHDIRGLLRKSNQVLIDQGGVFPIGGIRSRIVWLKDYCVADDSCADDAFVHATLKIGSGRGEADKHKVGKDLFDMLCAHFDAERARRGLALSLELSEFGETATWKKNNIHARYQAT